jgi:hypothetical protein
VLYWSGYVPCKSCSARSGFGRRSGNFENLEFGDFFGGGRIEENLLIGVKKRSIINSKKIISNIIIRRIS